MDISQTGLYNYLAGKDIDLLEKNVFQKEYKKGEEIYGPSEQYTYIHEIVNGAVKLGSISAKGVSVLHEIVAEKDFFGNLRLLENYNNSIKFTTVKPKYFSEFSKAIVPSVIRFYDYAFFKSLIVNDANVAKWFYATLLNRWSKTESLFISILSLPSRERIHYIFDQYNESVNANQQKKACLTKFISNQDIADLTGTTRQLVAETLKATK